MVEFILTSILPLFLHYFDHYASSLPFQLFTHSSERNYIFLFCNGILFFLIVNSSAARISQLGCDPIVEHVKKNANFDTEKTWPDVGNYKDKYPIEEDAEDEEDKEDEEDEEDEGDEGDEGDEEDEEEREEVDVNVIGLLNEEQEQVDSNQNGEDEDGIELLSVDELNRKCEDFIRNMRMQIGYGVLSAT